MPTPRKRPVPPSLFPDLPGRAEPPRGPRPPSDGPPPRVQRGGDEGPRRAVLTVSEAARRVKAVVEDSFPPIWVLGEISNLRQPRSGHLYASLKDGGALLHLVMFRGDLDRGLSAKLSDGFEVVVHGRLSTYERGSEVQLIADRIELHGQGALDAQKAELRRRFEAAGFFSRSRKRAPPRMPRRVGIVSSPTGAAIRDVLTTLDRRWPRLHIIIAPARVQGDGAAEQIAAGLDSLNGLSAETRPEVIILCRGGGSTEDLWAFNLEPVILAIARSEVPVVTGLGHEVDETLADLAADLRAATPTAAAELITPKLSDIEDRLDDFGYRQLQAIRARLRASWQRVDTLADRAGPRLIDSQIIRRGRELDSIAQRLDRSADRLLRRQRERLEELGRRLRAEALAARLSRRREQLELVAEQLQRAMQQRLTLARHSLLGIERERWERSLQRRIKQSQEALRRAAAELEALSPLKVLARGYSIVLRNDSVVRDSTELNPGDLVRLKLGSGQAEARITKVEGPSEATFEA